MVKFSAWVACLLPGLVSAASVAEEFSVARLDDNVFAIIRNDPPGFAVESYIINTHWHDDHIVGNRIYRDAYVAGPAITNAWNFR